MEKGYVEFLKPDGIFSGGCIDDYVNWCPVVKEKLKEEYSLFNKIIHLNLYLKRKNELCNSKTKEIKDMINSCDGVILTRDREGDTIEMSVANSKKRWEIINDISEKIKEITGKKPILNVCF